MSGIDRRMEQDRAKADLDRKLAVRRTLVCIEAHLLAAGPYDKLEVFVKQNGRGFTVRRTTNSQEEIDFEDNFKPGGAMLP